MRCAAIVFALMAVSPEATATSAQTQDRTITKVVKLLQEMSEKSKEEGDEERVLYAKFRCYCDNSEAEKKEEIEELTKTISLLESKIEELQGSSGEESTSSADLKEKMAANKQAQAEAEAIRKKEAKAFAAERQDLEEAIGQLKEAIETLSKVGADQTLSVGADHQQFMAGYKADSSLIQLRNSVQSALSVAQAFMNEKQYSSVASFVQAPFTGTYTSQSAEVLGILKNMRDTFIANLKSAIDVENKAIEAHTKFMELKVEEFNELVAQYKKAQDTLGDNDMELAAKRKQLSEAEKQKAEDEEFLAKLIPMCKDKAKEYEARKLNRANEEAAIAEAISILNSDSAFETFGTVDATSTGKAAFIQLSSVKRHIPDEDVRIVMQRLLRRAAAEEGHKSPRLNHVMSLLHAENPFDTVLDEIDKMIELINEESAQDKENLMWCTKERKTNKEELAEKKEEILKLEGEIDRLDEAINAPETGLKDQIAATEKSLLENDEAQKTETADRQESNVAYQKDIKNLVAAEELLTNAIAVLKAYYDKFDKSFIQEDPAPPETWEKYKGQSEGGNSAVSMLEFILTETHKEETEAHTAEEKAQADFEDSMTKLKEEQAKKEKSLAELQKTLADTEKDLLQAEDDLKATTKDKEAIEAYLEKIKLGCDFITQNFKLRTKSREIERDALEKAKGMLKDSPAYNNAEAKAKIESFGKCKEFCEASEEGVECKACMADVTIPGYCAGHPGTQGCDKPPAAR
jgi:hypothetical protein|eukprot:CAMPEP_0169131234 /NCGR_PEP_ID=MMETSP1015-20121227/38140_1 /TAXON_ID=342587 /ORGANISM="Karlodinium micrum, Strain CCMP2283" /LENGTH=746 /DNA_ID=CAMNT_0009195485 /DNA_START=69 /DNA_END=2309 /DNA_ORIENTATION=-